MPFLVWIAFGIGTGVIASKKGRNFLLWLLIGLVTGIIGLIIALCLSDKRSPQIIDVNSYAQQSPQRQTHAGATYDVAAERVRSPDGRSVARAGENTLICPKCNETYIDNERYCKHCGAPLQNVKTGT